VDFADRRLTAEHFSRHIVSKNTPANSWTVQIASKRRWRSIRRKTRSAVDGMATFLTLVVSPTELRTGGFAAMNSANGRR
jgi:hypothetical protein